MTNMPTFSETVGNESAQKYGQTEIIKMRISHFQAADGMPVRNALFMKMQNEMNDNGKDVDVDVNMDFTLDMGVIPEVESILPASGTAIGSDVSISAENEDIIVYNDNYTTNIA